MDYLQKFHIPKVLKYDNKIFLEGMETKKYTEMNLVTILFIHESIYRRFLKHFTEYINFEIIPTICY